LAVPGFVDVHTHGYDDVDFSTADPDGVGRFAASIVATGVTAFQPTLVALPVERLTELLSEPGPADRPGAARNLGFHLEGPFLSPEKSGAHDPADLAQPEEDVVARLLQLGKVAQITIAPELPGALTAIERFVEAGVTVSLGHSVADADITDQALSRGAIAFTHVFNAMGGFEHRAPGILGAALASGAFLTGIFDGIHLSYEAAVILIRCAGDHLVAITDGMATKAEALAGRGVAVLGGAVRLPGGTLAGSALTMDAAFRSLVDLGCDVTAAAHATSSAPSDLAGHDGGKLLPGHPADVVVLDDALAVRRVMVRGAEAVATV
jgi:N-acetylglucosamine-6-phosphate deacetylase